MLLNRIIKNLSSTCSSYVSNGAVETCHSFIHLSKDMKTLAMLLNSSQIYIYCLAQLWTLTMNLIKTILVSDVV